MSAKAIQIAKDIDVCRCKGNWLAIPELARRYKKHNPDGTVLEQTILAEASLINSVQATHSTVSFREDTPHQVTLPPRLSSQLKSVQLQLNAALQTADHGTSMDRKLATIVLARSHYEAGEYDKALEGIESLALNYESMNTGYSLILYLQAKYIQAICTEIKGNSIEALTYYESMVIVVNEPGAKERSFIDGAEEGLYRGCLLALRERSLPPPALLNVLRAYQKITALQNTAWRMQKRMVVTRYSLEYLSEVYRDGHYSAPDTLSDTHSASETQNERQMFVAEISALHLMYEKMLYTDLPFPRAGQVSTQVLDYVDQLASDIELISGSYYEIKGLIEALDRAAQRTFNSPRITRHIFNGLVKLGEYEEAENALRAYMYLVGLTSQAWVENRVCGEALVTNAKGYYVPVPTLDMEEEEGLASRRTVEHEPPEVIIGVLLKAVRMYCKDLGSGREAVELADMALKRWHRAEMAEYENGELKGQVYRAIGVAYSLLASQTNDPSLRPTYHEKAVQYLVQSIKIDANAWESYYQLALQQAEMREIRQAVQSISQSLQLNPGHIASWQLLTLACSSPVQNDIRQAVRTCEMGLKESQPTDSQPSEGGAATRPPVAGYSETEQAILLQITQSLLLNATQGPAVALQSQRKVFESYSKIAVSEQSQNSSTSSYQDTSSHGIVVSGSLGNLSEVQFVAENKRRNRSGSNVSSIGSMLDQKTDTLSNSFLADRARSTSSMNARPDRSLSVVNESENEPKSFHTHHGLHLFGSRSSSRRSRKEIPENLWTDKSQGSKLSLSDIRSGHLVSGSTQSLQSPTLSITSGRSIFHASSMPNKSTTRSRHRIQRSQRILSNLWLLSASLYLEQNNLEEARKAIEEAEHVEWTTNPHVWCMLGRLRLAEQNSELAMEAFEKGLVADPADVECKVWLAKIHKENEELEIAEGLLDSVTKGNGWDCSEAWFLLGEIYRETGRLEQTKACFFYALDLETTRPIQPFSILPRHV